MNKNITEPQIKAGMMALLQCSASDLESYSPDMYMGYRNDIERVFEALANPADAAMQAPGTIQMVNAYCENCAAMSAAEFRQESEAVTSRHYEDLCCKKCHSVLATLEGHAHAAPKATGAAS